MQPDARLIENKERVHETRAQAGGQIYAFDFATAECACGAIERKISKADFDEIAEP
jgi:hypothetical protein